MKITKRLCHLISKKTHGFSPTDDSYYFENEDNLFINNMDSVIVYDADRAYIAGMKIEKNNGCYGVKNIDNEVIIPFEYDEISFHDDLFEVKKNGEYYLINKENLRISASEEKNIPEIIKKGDLYGMVKDAEIIIPFSNEKLEFLSSDTIRRGNEMSQTPNELYDINGNIIIPSSNNINIFAVYDNKILVRDIKTNKMGVIDKRIISELQCINYESAVIPLEYDFLYKPHSEYDIYYFTKNDKNGLIIDGKEKNYNHKFDIEKISNNGYICGKIKNSENKKIVFAPDGALLLLTDANAIYQYNSSLLIKTLQNKFIVISCRKNDLTSEKQ